MRLSLPYLRVGDNSIRFINYFVQNGTFTLFNDIEVTDFVLSVLYLASLPNCTTVKMVLN